MTNRHVTELSKFVGFVCCMFGAPEGAGAVPNLLHGQFSGVAHKGGCGTCPRLHE